MNRRQLDELLFQAIETELGGEQVYLTALECAMNVDLKEEWQKYLDETRTHQQILQEVFEAAGLNIEQMTPGREVVRHKATALVEAMRLALQAGEPEAAQLVAAECIVEAETKDHQNWELLGQMVEYAPDNLRKAIEDAYDQVADQEAEHLLHTMGWARELWLDSLGVPAVLPPPEEQKEVTTKIGASRAEQQRDDYID
ncbi:MAG TPA: hypothetical protein VJR05_07315 [Acidimicrobiia bacterium]|nr:hypothetical protein [Acidimicrobiia bacterium]